MTTTMIKLPSRLTVAAIAALSAGLACAEAAMAQAVGAQTETPAQARARAATQSLNGGPADSVLIPGQTTASAPLTEVERAPVRVAPAPRPTAPRPTATRPATTRPAAPPPQTVRTIQTAPDDSATRLLNSSPPSVTADIDPTEAPEAVNERTPLVRGYYVKGDMDCDQVWPGEGNLAWLSDSSFTLDFGGCDPGQIVEVGPNTWHEDQRCQTELGGDGGVYSIQYEQTAADTIVRRATLSLDGSVEEDPWKLCSVEQVPEEARFHDQTR